MLHRRMMMRSSGGVIYAPIEYNGRTVGSNVGSASIPGGSAAGDLITLAAFDSTAVAALTSPLTDLGGVTLGRAGSFVLDAETTVTFAESMFPVLASFGNAQVRSVAVATGSDATITWASGVIERNNSAALMCGCRPAGTLGTLTYDGPSATVLNENGGNRQCAYLVNSLTDDFPGASVGFASGPDPWVSILFMLEPIA